MCLAVYIKLSTVLFCELTDLCRIITRTVLSISLRINNSPQRTQNPMRTKYNAAE